MRTKKFLTYFIIITFSLFFLNFIAIASSEKATEGEKEKPLTTLKVMAIANAYAYGMDLCADELREKLGVEFEYDLSIPQDAYSKAMMEFATKSSSVDIYLFYPSNLADYARHLVEIEPFMEKYDLDFELDDIMPAFRDLYCSWDGVICSIPFDGDQHNLFYNKTAFEDPRNKKAFEEQFDYDLHPPDTWDEYADMAKFFNGRDWDFDGEPEYGVAEAWQRGNYAYWWWWDKFIPMGGLPFDENINPLIASPAAQKALEITVDIVKYVPPGTANFGYPELENAFIKGDIPMVVQWSSTGKSAMDPDQSDIVNNVGIALLPGVKVGNKIMRRFTLPAGFSMGVPKYSKNAELAVRAMHIISRRDNALKIAMDPKTFVDGYRTSTFNAPEWDSMWPDYPGFAREFVEIQKKTVELAVPDIQIPGGDEYQKALDAEIAKAITGEKTVIQALKDGVTEWNAITDRRGRDKQKKAWLIQYNALKEAGIDYEPSWVK